MKRFHWVLLACLLTSLSAEAGKEHRREECPSKPGKVIVCHSHPRALKSKVLLAVNQTSVSHHAAHGDRIGVCEGTTYEEMKALCGVCNPDLDPEC